MEIIEWLLRSKAGSDSGGEDVVAFSEHFVAVIDGATSQSERQLNGLSGGQFAAVEIRDAIKNLPFDADAISAVNRLSQVIHQRYLELGVLEEMERAPLERAAASVAIYSNHRREVWLVGDCQCLMLDEDGSERTINNAKKVDEVNAAARALYVSSELARGLPVDTLQARDPGRHFITPLLKRQRIFQNSNIDSEFSYWVIDGFPIHATKGIRVVEIPQSIVNLVLATDGYPKLFKSLADSEAFLASLVKRDPLLIREFKSTKCVQAGQESYDDRAYVRVDTKVTA